MTLVSIRYFFQEHINHIDNNILNSIINVLCKCKWIMCFVKYIDVKSFDLTILSCS